jgi:uncharacterized protein (TIGR03067 family)
VLQLPEAPLQPERRAVVVARITLGLMLSFAAVALARGDGGTETDYTVTKSDDICELQRGSWKLVGVQLCDIDVPKSEWKQLDGCTFTFKPDKVIVRYPGETMEGKYKVDATKPRKVIDMTVNNKPVMGIYDLYRDRLILALSERERPTSFRTKKFDPVVFVLQRVKP